MSRNSAALDEQLAKNKHCCFPNHRNNTVFHPDHHPLRHHTLLHHLHSLTTGPFPCLNPTHAYFRHATRPHNVELGISRHTDGLATPSKDTAAPQQPSSGDSPNATSEEGGGKVTNHDSSVPPASTSAAWMYKWTARNNRKGRHAVVVNLQVPHDDSMYLFPPRTSEVGEVARGVCRMLTQFPVWDVSYLVAVIFTLGSVVWVVNAFFVYLPLVAPSTEFTNEVLYGGGITACIGATIFEVGSVLLLLEAVNANRTGCFGWAIEHVLEGHHRDQGKYFRLTPDTPSCQHHHVNHQHLLAPPQGATTSNGVHATSLTQNNELPGEQCQIQHSSNDGGAASRGGSTSRRLEEAWVWWPSWRDVRQQYIHDLGFLASFAQLVGATIFWISGITALPGILNNLSPALEQVVYWTPQVVGGSLFVVSGALFMVETQRKWYLPAPRVLGWHIGLWNLIGGMGFTLSPAFGYSSSSGAEYQAALSTFWGSWAFLIGSTIQWYESLQKFPVEHTKGTQV